jgi:predicted component of type VI protein secretion system
VTGCAFCGQGNDCGRPLSPTWAGEASAHEPTTEARCARCSGDVEVGIEDEAALVQGPRIARLDEAGAVVAEHPIVPSAAIVGRGEVDIGIPDDPFLSPLHARLEHRLGALWLRDLGSRNGSWIFLQHPARLADGDVLLLGGQLLRFRRLGYPGPRPPEADATRRLGSVTPGADVAVLEQLRADGSVRDTFHLSAARTVQIGRETGDWVFPYDQTMSSRHAEIRSEDGEFFVHDRGSRNGIALAVRGERPLAVGQRFLLGDQLFRVESV